MYTMYVLLVCAQALVELACEFDVTDFLLLCYWFRGVLVACLYMCPDALSC